MKTAFLTVASRLKTLRVQKGALLALAGALLASAAAAAAAPPAPTVADSNASAFLQYTAWAHKNDVGVAECKGIGRARKVAGGTDHARFRCRVSQDGKPRGVVIAKALGPEWLRVTRILSGELKPDRGIGRLPSGRPRIDSSDANTALENSAWARRNRIRAVFCFGVGRVRETEVERLYFTFSCATISIFGSRAGTVLVAVTRRNSVRVVRKLS